MGRKVDISVYVGWGTVQWGPCLTCIEDSVTNPAEVSMWLP